MTIESRHLLARFAAWTVPGFAAQLLGKYTQGCVLGAAFSAVCVALTVFSAAFAIWTFSSLTALAILVGVSVAQVVAGELYFRYLRGAALPEVHSPADRLLSRVSLILNFFSLAVVVIFMVVFFVQIVLHVGIYAVLDDSMQPAVNHGDFVVAVAGKPPASYAAGDLLVFRHPSEGRRLLKRIVARPGDVITFADGVFTNSSGFTRTYLTKAESRRFETFTELTVKEGCYLVFGDNLKVSKKDSLSFGCIGERDFVGQPKYIMLSAQLHDIGRGL